MPVYIIFSKLIIRNTLKMYIYFILISIIHLIISCISFSIFSPSYSKKNKTASQIQKDERYAYTFKENFPFLNIVSTILGTIPPLYWAIYMVYSKIYFDKYSNSTMPFIYVAIIASALIIVLNLKVSDEYNSRNSEMRRLAPNIGISINIFIYAASVTFAFTIIHFGNYALDFSTGEEKIVTITDSKHYTTNESKGGITHHYEIYFTPEVGGYSMVDVPSSLQKHANKDDKLKIYLKKGFFRMPYIGKKKILMK